ncbi:MAG: hypothetical protein ACOVNN_04170, partial [Limnohabitans sp.]
MKKNISLQTLSALALVCAVGLSACTKKSADTNTQAQADPDVIQVDATMMSQLKVTEVIYSELSDTLRVA